MSILWHEQCSRDVPETNAWLSERERSYLNSLTFSKRREDWRLGRWTAKCSVASVLGMPCLVPGISKIEIWPSRSGAPIVFVNHDPARLAISLSHRSGTAVCAVGHSSARIGCDLELIEPRDPAFVSDYFSPDEQATLEEAANERRSLMTTLMWSAKESALKALHLGLRLDTRRLEVSFSDVLSAQENRVWLETYPIGVVISHIFERGALANAWHPFQVRLRNIPAFLGWWQNTDQFVRTLLIRHSDARGVGDSTVAESAQQVEI